MTTQAQELAFGLDAGLWDVMSTTRAIRRLKGDPVPRQLLEQLIRAASWAPSAGNTQAQSWLIVTDRATLRTLAPIWARCLALYWASAGAAPAQTTSSTQHAAIRRASEHQSEHFAQIPALLIACHHRQSTVRGLLGNPRRVLGALAALGPRDALAAVCAARRASDTAEAASVYPAVQNVLLSARALGLGATLTTMHLTLESRFKRVLGIPRGVRTFAVIPVGYPQGRFGPVRRRPVAEITRWERY